MAIHNADQEDIKDTDFGSQINYRIGTEVEYFLPFNRNKWGVFVEPTYQYFKSERVSEPAHAPDFVVSAIVDYRSIEVPIGIRHYFYLKNNSSIFLNAAYILDFSHANSAVDFTWGRNNWNTETAFDIKTKNNKAFGAGFKYKNRYSVEARYHTPREVFSNSFGIYGLWNSDYKTFSLIFGYTLPN